MMNEWQRERKREIKDNKKVKKEKRGLCGSGCISGTTIYKEQEISHPKNK